MVNRSTRILLALFLWIAFSPADAQIVEWSNQQKLRTKTNYTRIIGEAGGGLYLVRARNSDFNRDVIIEKYKGNLALEKSEEFDQPSGSYIEKFLLQDDGIAVIMSKKNDSLPKIDVVCQRVNSALQANPAQQKLLARIDAGVFKNNTTIYMQPAVNRSNYAMMYFTAGTEKNTSVLHLLGFDQAMNATFNKSFNIQFPADDVVISGFECDNEGNAYLLIDYPAAGERSRKDKGKRDFFLYSYYKSMDKTLEYKIDQDSVFINDIALAVNNHNKTICIAGLYSTENNNKVTGSFVYSIDATSTLLKLKQFEDLNKNFTNKIITTMLNETGNMLSDIYIRRLIPRSDGGCTIIAEKHYESRQTYTYYANGFPQTASRITYNYDEIIVISKNGEGKTQFQDFIKKNQSSMNDGGYYSSFVLLNTNDKLSFVYNSDVNAEGDVMVSSINPLGNIDTKILVKAMSYYVLLMPAEARQISQNSTLVGTLKDRRFTLMKLTY
jgi:hypothetical protein